MAKQSNNGVQIIIAVGLVGAVLLLAYYLLKNDFVMPGPAVVAPEETVAPIETEADLEAANAELESTDLGQFDAQLELLEQTVEVDVTAE